MKIRVLVVDDEPHVTDLIRLCLEDVGRYEVRTENNSAVSVNAAREFKPDVIVLDIMMPEPDGSEVAACLAQDAELAEIPILFLTALVSQAEFRGPRFGLEQRCYLPKPVEFDSLIQHINALASAPHLPL